MVVNRIALMERIGTLERPNLEAYQHAEKKSPTTQPRFGLQYRTHQVMRANTRMIHTQNAHLVRSLAVREHSNLIQLVHFLQEVVQSWPLC